MKAFTTKRTLFPVSPQNLQFSPMDRCPATVAAELHRRHISPSPGNQFLLILSVVHVPTNFADSTLMDMEHPEIPPVLPTSDAPKQSPEVEPLTPPSRQDQRKLMKLLKKITSAA